MKERKKRTTNKEAFDNGYKKGMEDFEIKVYTIIDKVLEEYEKVMYEHPRNTKFVEIEIDAVKDLKEKILYTKHDKLL